MTGMISGTTNPYMKQRIFVFEFITGGGLAGQPRLPSSLLREGRLMRDALLRDAAALPDVDITLLHDARLPPPDADRAVDQDDTLTLLFMCCHPALTPPSAIALTLLAIKKLTHQLALTSERKLASSTQGRPLRHRPSFII